MSTIKEKPLILGLGFSPRKNGNSDQLLKWAMAGARRAGAETRALFVRDHQINPCRNCRKCEDTGVCVQKDDFARVSREIDAADCLVIASPVYFLGVPSHAKALIDRFQCYWVRKHLLDKPPARDNRPALLLMTAGSEKDDVFACARRTINAFLSVSGFRIRDEHFFPGVDKKGAIKCAATAKNQAEQSGRRLACGKTT